MKKLNPVTDQFFVPGRTKWWRVYEIEGNGFVALGSGWDGAEQISELHFQYLSECVKPTIEEAKDLVIAQRVRGAMGISTY